MVEKRRVTGLERDAERPALHARPAIVALFIQISCGHALSSKISKSKRRKREAVPALALALGNVLPSLFIVYDAYRRVRALLW